MASNSIPSQLCRQDVQNPGVIRAASCWKGESLPCRSQRLLAILGRHWLVHASARLCLQLPMGSYTLGLQISLFLVELWLIRIAVWQKLSHILHPSSGVPSANAPWLSTVAPVPILCWPSHFPSITLSISHSCSLGSLPHTSTLSQPCLWFCFERYGGGI